MAIFKVQRDVTLRPGIIETPGKIYIEGQAHDSSTLAPLFNQGWPGTDVNYGRIDRAMPLYSMSSRFWSINTAFTVNIQASFGAFDLSLIDCGQGRLFHGYRMVNSSNTFILGPDYSLSYESTSGARFFNLDNLTFSGNTTAAGLNGTWDRGIGGIFFERDANNVYMLWHSAHNYTGRWDASTWRLMNLNPSNRTITANNISEVTNSGPSNLVLIHESPTHFYFYNAKNDGNVNVAKTHSIGTLEKSNFTFAWRATNNRPAVTGGPAYFPSHAINTSGNNYAMFMGEYAGGTASKISFAVVQFDQTTPATSPTWTNVTPTGATASPGTLTQTGALTLRTWAFQSGSNTYICVGAIDQASNNTGSTAVTDYFIHVYKCATSAPTTIQYVSSVSLSGSLRPKAIIPVDSTFSNVIVPFTGSVSFFYWDAGNERYVLGSSLSLDPRYISVDQTGRIWITEANSTFNANLHVVSPTISSTVTVQFQNPNITYAGTVVDSNLLVSAFNFSGSRIASTVTLQLDTNSATFADGTTSRTVTTLTSGNLSVPIKITAAGYVRVLANISI